MCIAISIFIRFPAPGSTIYREIIKYGISSLREFNATAFLFYHHTAYGHTATALQPTAFITFNLYNFSTTTPQDIHVVPGIIIVSNKYTIIYI